MAYLLHHSLDHSPVLEECVLDFVLVTVGLQVCKGEVGKERGLCTRLTNHPISTHHCPFGP
jgi:hypothetical protein